MHMMSQSEGGTSKELIEAIASRLTQLRQRKDAVADQNSWEIATVYVTAYQRIADALSAETGKESTPQRVNRHIRSVPGYKGPGGSWLSHARRTHKVFNDVFAFESKILPYNSYMQIANCSLLDPAKRELRAWAEKQQPSQAELRERITGLVAGFRPDFDLKTTDSWKFSRKLERAEFDGGIHPDLVANLLYYFTDPGDTILDPMAGGDTTHRVLQKFAFFHAVNPALDQSGPRHLIRSDIEPISPGIRRADVREIDKVIEFGSIDFCLLDPPYWRIAKGKYEIFGDTIEQWCANIGQALRAISRTLKPGGKVAVIVEDFRRSRQYEPLTDFVRDEAKAAGYQPREKIYNLHPNAVTTMDARQMWRCMRARLLVSEYKVIQVFEAASNPPHLALSNPPSLVAQFDALTSSSVP
jgi:hypothetical protein